ncbi:hypothetical protein EJ02DRAFT_457797 [Clathrospora elynae]|uniref:Uncharacterized protein n=1 Tax=Clathrospora elynae TaxID=706981 RepID=A0A6A5SFU1_9PLEO|nr:hypothetical protein EJ02DRAFT_457797 [Clathrospora elynae]
MFLHCVRQQYTDFVTRTLGSCGDKFGSETAAFAKSVHLQGHGRNAEYQSIHSCLERLKPYGHVSAAVYLSNACHVVYTLAAPPDTNSWQEQDNQGQYWDNLKACKVYWRIIQREKNNVEEKVLNSKICEAWSNLARDLDGRKSSRPDFSNVNEMVKDHACKHWR